ncbi:hypothetical protein CBR_g48512 [Chara braunii]|uniref:Uncharacterized protein n=1 Tax=Chara braunii TaxID=69332 RepID=A0A388M2U3_CHABU|nr:hypothetical protein CBR_g48512 [Chara braunii]|eukprot:GBG88900.1 hypothetical protein CBR_g48512 [Chara braunii]
MSVAQVEAALAEIMKYAKEGVHYNGDNELSLLEDRVSRYFIVGVDMRSTIMANGEGCVKARTLLQCFRESPHVCVDSDVEGSAYSLKGVVEWMCSEGMCEEGDVDMTMQQKGGTYKPADFKKLLGTVARNGEMLIDGSKEELKSGAAEILVLSRMKDITQTPPEDFQDVLVIVADGVKYVLLDQLVDFLKKTTREELVYSDIFNAFTMEKEQCDRGFEEADFPSCFAEYTDNAEEEDEEEDEGASSSDVEASGNDVSSDEEDEEHDVYYDLKAAGGQVTKGLAHAILSLARAFLDPHKVLRVVMKEATPDGALHGVVNRPPKAPEKRSREDRMSKVHRRTKKRITYKKDRMVEMIDLRAWDDMYSEAREEAEEEHDQSISQKSYRKENEATSDEGGDSETSDGYSCDTHDADDEDGRSSDGAAQDEGGDAAGEDNRSADGERVLHLWEERDARGNPKVAAREAQPTRPPLTDN